MGTMKLWLEVVRVKTGTNKGLLDVGRIGRANSNIGAIGELIRTKKGDNFVVAISQYEVTLGD